MLTATYHQQTEPSVASAQLMLAKRAAEPVCIVGGGIASLCLALQLVTRGIPTTLLCADDQVAAGASHNLQGAVYPNLHPALTAASLLHCQAFYFARHFYQRLANSGSNFAMQWCGVLHLATNPALAQRQQKIIAQANWPSELVYPVSAATASQLAGVKLAHGGIFLPQAGWLSPQQFCQAALKLLTQSALFSVKFNCQVSELAAAANSPPQWQIHYQQDGCDFSDVYPQVVLANGAEMARFSQSQHLPVNRVRGQVSHVSSAGMQPLRTVLCHKGYITPALAGSHAVGATFDRAAQSAFISDSDNSDNLALVNSQLQQPSWFADAAVTSARAAFRATVPDHLPLLGEIITGAGLYAIGGLGARGILLAPLLAEALACQLSGQPIPLPATHLQTIAATRFNKTAATA